MGRKWNCLTVKSVSVEVNSGAWLYHAHKEAANLAAYLGVRCVDYEFNGRRYTAFAHESDESMASSPHDEN